MAGDLAQVVVAERRQQAGHQFVVTAAVAEVAQLVEKIASGLAGDARVVAVGGGAAFLAVAAGASEQALAEAVFEWRRWRGGERRGHPQADGADAAGDARGSRRHATATASAPPTA